MGISNDCFVEALRKKMKEQGRGAKKSLAANVGVSPNHLSDILAKRKNAGQKLKERIAETLDLTFEDMLVLGRHLVEDRIGGESGEKEQSDSVVMKAQCQKPIKAVDYMAMCAKILESSTPYRQALMNNIMQYYQEMETAQKGKKALQMIQALQKEINIMREDINALRQTETGEKDSTDIAAA